MYLSTSSDGWDDWFGNWKDTEFRSMSPYGKALLYNWFHTYDTSSNAEVRSYLDNEYSELPEDWRVALKWTDEWYRQNPNASYKEYLDKCMEANKLYWDRWETTPEGKFATATNTGRRRRDPSNLSFPYYPVEDTKDIFEDIIPDEDPLLPWEDPDFIYREAGPWDPNDYGTYDEENENPDIFFDELETENWQDEHPELTYKGIYDEIWSKYYPAITREEADRMTKARLNSL